MTPKHSKKNLLLLVVTYIIKVLGGIKEMNVEENLLYFGSY